MAITFHYPECNIAAKPTHRATWINGETFGKRGEIFKTVHSVSNVERETVIFLSSSIHLSRSSLNRLGLLK